MLIFYALLLVATVMDILYLKKNKDKKQIVVYTVASVLVLALSIYFYSNPYRESLLAKFFHLFNIEGKLWIK